MIKCGRGMCKHAKCSLQQAVSRTGEGDLQPSNHQQTRSLSFSVASSSLIASTPCLTLTNHSRDKLQSGRSCWGVQQRSIVTKARSRTHLYDVLGITPKASQAEIKTAYYRLSKMHHPDIDKNEGANVRFAEISEAYEVLGNVSRRRMYDHGAFQGGRSSSGHATPQEEDEDYTRPFREQEGFGTERQAPPTGRTQQYNFDEFYRQHYSEQVRQKQAGMNYWKEMEREADHDRTQRMIRTIVTGSMLLALIVTFFGLDKTPGRKTMKKKE